MTLIGLSSLITALKEGRGVLSTIDIRGNNGVSDGEVIQAERDLRERGITCILKCTSFFLFSSLSSSSSSSFSSSSSSSALCGMGGIGSLIAQMTILKETEIEEEKEKEKEKETGSSAWTGIRTGTGTGTRIRSHIKASRYLHIVD